MTYRELIVKLMKLPTEVLDQNIVIYNEEDYHYYGCTGHDVVNDESCTVPEGTFFLMVNI